MNRNLNLLLGGQMVSQMGDKFHMLAVAYMVLKTTGSPAKMGLVLFCSIFPGMILGFVSGAVIDRYSRKGIIVVADVARGIIVLAMSLLYAANCLSFPLLLLAQVSISVCTAFFDPAVPAMLPQIVKQEALTRANSKTQLVSGIATIAGPVLGGLTVAWSGYLAAFVVNAFSYLFSALFESFIRLAPVSRQNRAATKIWEDIKAGCCYVANTGKLLMILVMVALIHLLVGAVEAVIPILATQLTGSGAANIGYVQTAFGVGSVLAAFGISVHSIHGKEVGFLFASVCCMGAVFLLISSAFAFGIRNPGGFLFFFLCLGSLVIFAGTSFRSLIQRQVPEEMLGRVFGFVSSVGNISIPLAILLSSMLLEKLRLDVVLAVCGLLLIPLALGSWRLYQRHQA
jgi:DHA3 family macrolide efflux protein-like MFS transporter